MTATSGVIEGEVETNVTVIGIPAHEVTIAFIAEKGDKLHEIPIEFQWTKGIS